MTLRIALLVIAASAVATRPAASQFVSSRIAVAFPGERHPSVQAGVESRGEIGGPTSSVDSMGVTHRKPPGFLWSGMVLAGGTWARAGQPKTTPRATAQVQLGVLDRVTSATRVGVYGVWLAEPGSWGGLVRYEPMSAAALQAGWLHRSVGPADVAMVQLDVAAAFFTDLFFGGAR